MVLPSEMPAPKRQHGRRGWGSRVKQAAVCSTMNFPSHVGRLRLNATPKWYAKRPYVHFDLPLSSTEATAYVSDPLRVASHSFYPLLSYKIITPRIRKSGLAVGKPFIKDPKSRPIAYPAHKDGYIFSYYKAILEIQYEDWLESQRLGDAVTAFRSKGENNITLAKKAFAFIAGAFGLSNSSHRCSGVAPIWWTVNGSTC